MLTNLKTKYTNLIKTNAKEMLQKKLGNIISKKSFYELCNSIEEHSLEHTQAVIERMFAAAVKTKLDKYKNDILSMKTVEANRKDLGL
jgi:hypothetical protein